MDKYNVPIENVIRHYDVTGKKCPEPYVRSGSKWRAFKDEVKKSKKADYKVKVTASKLRVRAGAGVTYKTVTTVSKGDVFTIVKVKGNWGRLKSGKGWISLKYTRKI